MKTRFVIYVFLLLAFPLFSQTSSDVSSLPKEANEAIYSRHSVGGSYGISALGASWKFRPKQKFAMTLDCTFSTFYMEEVYAPNGMWSHDTGPGVVYYWAGDMPMIDSYLQLSLLYQHYTGKPTEFFIGLGYRMGYSLGFQACGLKLAAALCVGFEHHCPNIPMDISFEVRPTFGGFPANDNKVMFMTIPVQLTLRRRF